MIRVVQCRKCGATSANGDEFGVILPYKSAGSFELVMVDDDGNLVIGVGDPGQPTEFLRPEIRCSNCGHQWVSNRNWRPDI